VTRSPRELTTRRGPVKLPAYIPVTTFGDTYPLDKLLTPFLPRLAQAVMVSYHYARQMTDAPRLPLFLDSGGFASISSDSRVVSANGLGLLEIAREHAAEITHPRDVLDLQERIADVAFTLDFPIPPGMNAVEATERLDLTVANAHWALANRRRRDLLLFACVQAWDASTARACARAYAGAAFDGFAIGGLVPRARDLRSILAIVEAVRGEIDDRPLHVFGLGKPEVVAALFKVGVSSVDSTAHIKLAADGRLWSDPNYRIDDPSLSDRLHLALCNLATAAATTLPLSTSSMVFSTAALAWRRKARGVHSTECFKVQGQILDSHERPRPPSGDDDAAC